MRCYLGVGQPVLFNLFTQEHREHFLRGEDQVVAPLTRNLAQNPLEQFLLGKEDGVDAFLERLGPSGHGYETLKCSRIPTAVPAGRRQARRGPSACQRIGLQPDEVFWR